MIAAALLGALVGHVVGAAPRTFLEDIRSAERRDRAACAVLAKLEEGAEEPCRVTHVVETVGPRGRPVFIVFFKHAFSDEYQRPGEPKGHFEVFDAGGKHLKWFGNANVLQGDDVLLQPVGAPAVVVQHILVGVDCSKVVPSRQALLRVVHAISLGAPERAILSVVLGPPTREYRVVKEGREGKMECSGHICTQFNTPSETEPVFSWEARASCTRGRCEVSIGPREELARGEPAATWKWPAASPVPIGPKGSPEERYLRFEDRCGCDPLLQRFAVATGDVSAECLKQLEPRKEGCRESSEARSSPSEKQPR